jgi:hypothetical protein
MYTRLIAAAAILAVVLTAGAVYAIAEGAEARPAVTFPDVPKNSWYYEFVSEAADSGIISGDNFGRFNPGQFITRGQFVTIIGRIAGIDTGVPKARTYYDIPVTSYLAPYVAWGSETGITGGYEDGTFKPDRPVSRQAAAIILDRFLRGYLGLELIAEQAVFTYADESGFDLRAAGAIYKFTSAGIFAGDSYERFNPNVSMTRAEAAKVISLFLEALETAAPLSEDYDAAEGGADAEFFADEPLPEPAGLPVAYG